MDQSSDKSYRYTCIYMCFNCEFESTLVIKELIQPPDNNSVDLTVNLYFAMGFRLGLPHNNILLVLLEVDLYAKYRYTTHTLST